MNEKKKLIIILSIVVLIIIAVIGFEIFDNKRSEKMYNEFEEKFNSEENSLIYIGRPTCGYCNLLNPSIEDMKERYNFSYTYINTDVINSKYLNKILQELNISSLGTPYLAIVSNGSVVDTQNGYADYDKVFELLQKNNIISSDAELLLNYIDLDSYNKIIKSKDSSIIVVGQSTCQYCVKAKVILNDIVASNNTEINYLNLSYLTEDEYNEFKSSFEYFQDEFGTPVTLIVKDGKIVDKLEQLVSKEEYIEFFEQNGVL
jgi:predicted bacteriocin transport accessory protein